MIYTWATLFITFFWRLLKRENPLRIQSVSFWPQDAPFVSVIIPCHNHLQYIAEAIQSVLEQAFQDFEIIVVNDGSTEAETIHILKSLELPKTPVIHLPENRGLTAARNAGIREAQGKYICCLDALYEATPFVYVLPNLLPQYARREAIHRLKTIWKVSSTHTLSSASHIPACVGVDPAGR